MSTHPLNHSPTHPSNHAHIHSPNHQTMFLLPPVPGVPVYLSGGIILVRAGGLAFPLLTHPGVTLSHLPMYAHECNKVMWCAECNGIRWCGWFHRREDAGIRKRNHSHDCNMLRHQTQCRGHATGSILTACSMPTQHV